MALMGLPDATVVEIAPTYGRVQISTIPTPSWIDISAYTLSGKITRGTNHELQMPDAGRLTLKLNNYLAGGALTPSGTAGWITNAASIVPDGVAEMPIRVYMIVAGTIYMRFSGYVSKWGPSSYSNGDWSTIDVTAYDQLKAATDCYFPSSYLGQNILNTGTCVWWYACNDTSTTRLTNKSLQNFGAYDSTGNTNNGTFGAVPNTYLTTTLGQQPLPVFNLEANTLTANAAGIAVTSSAALTLNMLVSLDNTQAIQTAAPMLIASCTDSSNGWVISAVYDLVTGQWFPRLELWKSGVASYVTSTVAFDVSVAQMLTLTLSGGTYTLYLNGGTAGAALVAAASSGFGAGSGWQGTLPASDVTVPSRSIVFMGNGTGTSVAPGGHGVWYGGVGDMALCSSAQTASTIATWWGWAFPIKRQTGAWIAQQLSALGSGASSPATDQIVDIGISSLVEPDPSQTDSTSVRSLLEQTVFDEVGQLWVDQHGNIVFRQRDWTSNNPNIQATFGTGVGDIPIFKADWGFDDTDLWTHISGARSSGNPIIVATSTATSVSGRTGGFGIKTFHVPGTFNTTTDAEVYSLLYWIVGKYNKEQTRVRSIQCKPWVHGVSTSSPNWATLFALDIWTTIAINMVAGPGLPGRLATALLIEGIDDEFDFEKGDYTVTISTSPAWNNYNSLAYVQPGTRSVGTFSVAG